MRSNRLCLNSEKTEFLWCATSRRCPHLDTRELSVCGSLIRPVTVARDLGVLFQSDLSMKVHVARAVSRCFRQLRLLKGCIKSLPFEVSRAAVAAFVTSQIDRNDSLLVGAPKYLLDCLQSVLNAAARLLCNRRKYDHVTPFLPFESSSRSACWSTSRFMGQRLGICATIVRRRIRPLRGYDF